MEKLLNNYMTNPTPVNRSKLIAYESKHMMATCGLSQVQLTILNQIKREAA